MLHFRIDALITALRNALVNPALGVEKDYEFWLHESLAPEYQKAVLAAIEKELRERLQLPAPGTSAPDKPRPDPAAR